MKKPWALRPNDTIGIVAPAGPFVRESLEAGIDLLRSWGFNVCYRDEIFHHSRYLAGPDWVRAALINQMFADPGIRAILCAKAGYGSGRVIPLLNHTVIHRHPKIFVGYSDITLLLSYFLSCPRMITFHGPVVAGELYHGMSRQTASQLYDLLTGVDVPYPLLTHVEVIRSGTAEGRLVGGNLSRIIETIGTFYELRTQDTILFLEDTDIYIEDLDTMLVHLQAADKLASIRGIIIGMLREEGGRRLDAEAIGKLWDGLFHRRIPIIRTPKCGHGRLNLTLPLGAHVKINTGMRKVMLLESPVRTA